MDGFLIFLAAFLVLFLLPGLGVSGWLYPRDQLHLLDRVPLAFGLSLGLFLGPFLIATVFQLGWDAVYRIWAVLCLLVLVGGAMSWRRARNGQPKENGLSSDSTVKLLGIFLLLLIFSAIITLYTRRDPDDWSYYAIVRRLADAARFTAPTPTALRSELSLWWFFHAFLLRGFDLDIVRLGQDYLPFVLVPLSILSFFFLASTLFQDRRRALLASCLQIGSYLFDLFQNNPDVQLTGGWVLGRIDQDHTAAQFIMLPLYAALMIRYLREGGIRWLAACFGALLALALVHPQGFVWAGILTIPFLLLHWVVDHRQAEWKRGAMTLLPFVIVLLLLVPYILYWRGFTLSTDYFDLARLAESQTSFPWLFRWIMFLAPEHFILRPDLLGQPILLAALLLTPGLLPLLRRDYAQYLFALTVALVLILYNPFVFPWLSGGLGWSAYRLWYLFPSALIIALLGPRAYHLARRGLSQWRDRKLGWNAAGLVLVVAGLVLVAGRFPSTFGAASAELSPTHSLPAGSSELLEQLRQRVMASSVGGPVLAPREISDAIPSYHNSLSPVLFRNYMPDDRVYDAALFYEDALLTASDVGILGKYHVAYLILPSNLECVSQFDLFPSYFEPIFRNREWILYRVLNPLPVDDPLITANTIFVYGEWQGATDQYNSVLSDEMSTDAERSLAHTGLGMLLELSGLTRKAIAELEQAVQIEPQNAQAHFHLVGLYRKLGMEQQAALHAQAAGPLVQQAVSSGSER